LANNAGAATTYFFDVNGTTSGFGIANGGSYSWDNPVWSTSSAGTAATANWVAGGFARFGGGSSGNAYTVTVNNDESMAGVFEAVSGVGLTINGAGAGTVDIASGDQGFLVSGSASSVTINAPISGVGGLAPESSGSLYLNGNNTYSGGTAFGYSGVPLTHFNNNNAFGSAAIRIVSGVSSGTFFGLLGAGGATITLPNTIQPLSSGAGFNFAADANTPVVLAGGISMAANNFNLRSSGGSSSPLTVSGVISGTANLALSANNSSAIILTGANTYSGTTTVGVGGTPVTLKLGAANTIASSSSVILAGGILDPGGLNHTMSAATLGLTASSTIDYISASELDFANSSSLSWSGTLNLADWTGDGYGPDRLRIGTDSTGLTASQLAEIEFNGSGLGTAGIDPNGYIYMVPEPSSVALLGLIGGLGVMWNFRRRKA